VQECDECGYRFFAGDLPAELVAISTSVTFICPNCGDASTSELDEGEYDDEREGEEDEERDNEYELEWF
jgi:hypothetical protein